MSEAFGGERCVTEIEAILTAYVSSVVYSAFEAQVRVIVAKRGAGDGSDTHLASFSAYATRRLVRSIKIGELSGAAAWFHPDCQERFRDAVQDEDKDAWDTIVVNRHGAAHNDEGRVDQVISNLTFADLQALYPKALRVLEAFADCLNPRKVS